MDVLFIVIDVNSLWEKNMFALHQLPLEINSSTFPCQLQTRVQQPRVLQ